MHKVSARLFGLPYKSVILIGRFENDLLYLFYLIVLSYLGVYLQIESSCFLVK